MIQAVRLLPAQASKAVLIFGMVICATVATFAQGPTPDPFVLQITHSTIPTFAPTPSPSATPTPTPVPTDVNSYAKGLSGNGRFVVLESEGDVATVKPGDTVRSPGNTDGNREIFLFDYAQRRIFQITNTRSTLKVATNSPTDITNIDVEVSNNRPVISYDGKWIVFSSNAGIDGNASKSPKNFDGNEPDHATALKADGNQEIWLYRIPDVADVDLATGLEAAETDLSSGTFTRVTNTTATFLPIPGATGASPQVADDNRFPQVNDDASVIAFVSSRNITGGNADTNPEIFAAKRTTGEGGTTVTLAQLTTTADPAGTGISSIFNANPSLSGSGALITFASTADNLATPAEADTAKGNVEVFIGDLNLLAAAPVMSNVRQVTRTAIDDPSTPLVNLLSSGRRLSRDGTLLAFESRAEFTADGNVSGALQAGLATWMVRITPSAFAFTKIGPRPSTGNDVVRHPTFSGDNLNIVFASLLNFKADGTAVENNSTEGLNPFGSDGSGRRVQIFSTPVATPTSFTRLTKAPVPVLFPSDTQPFVSETINRIAFSYARSEFGGGNPDNNFEAYYQFIKPMTSDNSTAGIISFFTGASERPVVGPSPAPTPPAVSGLAPGMIGLARSITVQLAQSVQEVVAKNAEVAKRKPPLPVELNGVSLSINNSAAGLYFVSPGQLNFVVPAGLASSSTAYPVVINNRGSVFRTTLVLNPAQPDIATTTGSAGGRALVSNVTNALAPTEEPPGGFPVETVVEGQSRPTKLRIMLTGVLGATAGETTVTIKSVAAGGKNQALTGTAIKFIGGSLTAGWDQIEIELPADLAGAGESTLQVSVAKTGGTFSSRPEDTAPRIRIQ